MFKHPDPIWLALKTSLQKKFHIGWRLDPPQRPQNFELKNALIRGFPKALNSNTAPNIVLANVKGTLFGLYWSIKSYQQVMSSMTSYMY